MINNATSPKGFVQGTGVVRDKDGKIKCEFKFEGEATPEQVKGVFGEGSLARPEGEK